MKSVNDGVNRNRRFANLAAEVMPWAARRSIGGHPSQPSGGCKPEPQIFQASSQSQC